MRHFRHVPLMCVRCGCVCGQGDLRPRVWAQAGLSRCRAPNSHGSPRPSGSWGCRPLYRCGMRRFAGPCVSGTITPPGTGRGDRGLPCMAINMHSNIHAHFR